MASDTIVVDDYCVACQGPCGNSDPENYEHMYVEWERLLDTWTDRGVTPSTVWAFLGSIVLSIAKESGATWSEVEDALHAAWRQGIAAQGDGDA